jgi:hypothetical protein
MNDDAIERARQRLAGASDGRVEPAEVEAALERARSAIEQVAELGAQLESTLPGQVGEAVREGVRAEALPVARQLAEVRGLVGHSIRRLERIEGDGLAERNARVDDLALLVELITSGWRTVDERMRRIEERLESGDGAIVYRIEERKDQRSQAI